MAKKTAADVKAKIQENKQKAADAGTTISAQNAAAVQAAKDRIAARTTPPATGGGTPAVSGGLTQVANASGGAKATSAQQKGNESGVLGEGYTSIGGNRYADQSGQVYTLGKNGSYKPVTGSFYGVQPEATFTHKGKTYAVDYDGGGGKASVYLQNPDGTFKQSKLAYDPYSGVMDGKKTISSPMTWTEGGLEKFGDYQNSQAAKDLVSAFGWEEGTVPVQMFGGFGADPYASKRIGDKWYADLGNGHFAQITGNKVTDYANTGQATFNPATGKWGVKQDPLTLAEDWSSMAQPESWSTKPMLQNVLQNYEAGNDIIGQTYDAKGNQYWMTLDGKVIDAKGNIAKNMVYDPSSFRIYSTDKKGNRTAVNNWMTQATSFFKDPVVVDDTQIGGQDDDTIDMDADLDGNGIPDWYDRILAEQQATQSGGEWGDTITNATSYTQPTSPYTGGMTPWTTTTSGWQSSFTPSFGQSGTTPWTWGDSVTAGLNASDSTIYDYLQNAIKSGSSMSQATALMGLDPGDISSLTNRMNQYASSNNLPWLDFANVPSGTAGYYNYGLGSGQTQTQYTGPTGQNWGVNPIDPMLDQITAANKSATPGFARGGMVPGGLNGIQQDPVIKRYMKHGASAGGQDDVIDAKLAPNEYVFDADVVAALGDGNPDAGAAKLDKMRMNIRKHKRSAKISDIPPRAKAPEQYLKGGK